MRIAQGIGVGGEWGGSVLMSMEWGESHRKGLMASFPQLGVPIGLLLSTGMIRLMTGVLSPEAFDSWGWRVPFLLSFVLVLIGLYVRLRVLESPEFREVKKADAVVKRPFIEVLKEHPMEILTSAFVRMSEQAPFYIFITFVLTYGTTILKIEPERAAQLHPRGRRGRVHQRPALRLRLGPDRAAADVRHRDRLHRRCSRSRTSGCSTPRWPDSCCSPSSSR